MASKMRQMNAFERHKWLISEYEKYYSVGSNQTEATTQPAAVKTDFDTLKEQYRFIRTEEDDEQATPWERALAQKYYQQLFREYAIIDLSRYKEGKFGCRWRTKEEVVKGKGQFFCGAKQCEEKQGLESFEVPFSYIEAGRQKRALVKVRICQEHAMQLNYKKNRKMLKLQRKRKERNEEKARSSKKEKRKKTKSSSDTFEEEMQGIKSQNPELSVERQPEKGIERKQKQCNESEHSLDKPLSGMELHAQVDSFLAEMMP